MDNKELEKYVHNTRLGQFVIIGIFGVNMLILLVLLLSVKETQRLQNDRLNIAYENSLHTRKELRAGITKLQQDQRKLLEHLNLRFVDTPAHTIPAKWELVEGAFETVSTNVVYYLYDNLLILPAELPQH